jgi:AcrR family transcriptional regulator
VEQKEISAATRAALLDAAGKVILEKGVGSLTLEAVAREAGVSKGGLFYHFSSKRKLIEALIARLMARVDSALEEELAKNGGDYIDAYIRASFIADPERNRISCALFAAHATDSDLIKPLQARFQRMQEEILATSISPELGTIIRLALDGLYFSEVFGFAPPPAPLREKMQTALLVLARTAGNTGHQDP